jgi:hypothetical protein
MEIIACKADSGTLVVDWSKGEPKSLPERPVCDKTLPCLSELLLRLSRKQGLTGIA